MPEDRCPNGQHDWQPTPNRDLERCSKCPEVRHLAFVDRSGQSRVATRTTTSVRRMATKDGK